MSRRSPNTSSEQSHTSSSVTTTLTSSKLDRSLSPSPSSASASSSSSSSEASGDSSSSSSSDDDDDDDEGGADDDAYPSRHLKELFLKAKAAIKAKSLPTAQSGDKLALQDEVVLFGEDDDDDEIALDGDGGSTTPRASTSKLPSKLLRPVQITAPTSLSLINVPSKAEGKAPEAAAAAAASASKEGITLAQDLAGLIEAAPNGPGEKWGKAPTKSLSKKEQRARHPRTAGPQWFNLPAPEMTPELKREVQAMKLRNSLDPKRFYRGSVKQDKAMPEFFSVGHVLPSSTRATTASLCNDNVARKRTFVEELVDDEQARAYTKRKTLEVMERGMSGRKGKAFRKRPKTTVV